MWGAAESDLVQWATGREDEGAFAQKELKAGYDAAPLCKEGRGAAPSGGWLGRMQGCTYAPCVAYH